MSDSDEVEFLEVRPGNPLHQPIHIPDDHDDPVAQAAGLARGAAAAAGVAAAWAGQAVKIVESLDSQQRRPAAPKKKAAAAAASSSSSKKRKSSAPPPPPSDSSDEEPPPMRAAENTHMPHREAAVHVWSEMSAVERTALLRRLFPGIGRSKVNKWRSSHEKGKVGVLWDLIAACSDAHPDPSAMIADVPPAPPQPPPPKRARNAPRGKGCLW